MAHFAEIDANNKVIRVLVVDNSQEHRGEEFLANDCNLGGRWIQTSYNANIRGKYAAIGDIYDQLNDVFITPIEEIKIEGPIIKESIIEESLEKE